MNIRAAGEGPLPPQMSNVVNTDSATKASGRKQERGSTSPALKPFDLPLR
jgi:hypothetical protein